MIASFKVLNYRQFADLEMSGLKRVNLVVGENGVGKSSLLEALWLYNSAGSYTDTVLDIISSREEVWRRGLHIEFPGDYARHPISTITGGDLSDIGLGFSFFITAGYGDNTYSTSFFRIDFSGYGSGNLGFSVEVDDIAQERASFSADVDFQGRRFSCKRGDNVYVPAAGLDQKGVADFWERISLTDVEDEVEAALKTFVPGLLRLSLIAGRPVAKLRGASSPVPLRRLGEGVSRAFALMAAMANARNGVLLIDEIETGLYRTTLMKIWPFLFEAAKRLNVQVFATTHSWDCIAGFAAAAKATPEDDGALVRLENRDGKIVAVQYDEKQLAIATEHGIEVR